MNALPKKTWCEVTVIRVWLPSSLSLGIPCRVESYFLNRFTAMFKFWSWNESLFICWFSLWKRGRRKKQVGAIYDYLDFEDNVKFVILEFHWSVQRRWWDCRHFLSFFLAVVTVVALGYMSNWRVGGKKKAQSFFAKWQKVCAYFRKHNRAHVNAVM